MILSLDSFAANLFESNEVSRKNKNECSTFKVTSLVKMFSLSHHYLKLFLLFICAAYGIHSMYYKSLFCEFINKIFLEILHAVL